MSRGPASVCAVAGGSSSAEDCREGLRGSLPTVGGRVIVRQEKT